MKIKISFALIALSTILSLTGCKNQRGEPVNTSVPPVPTQPQAMATVTPTPPPAEAMLTPQANEGQEIGLPAVEKGSDLANPPQEGEE